MWYFFSPQIVFGEDALSWLAQLKGKRAFIVTDAVMEQIGFVGRVTAPLQQAGLEWRVFNQVEPDPSITTVEECARQMAVFQPDWIIALGGGSSLDAAKVAWFRYECPDVPIEAINPLQEFGLRSKARLITIPTTAGSGAEVTAAAVITDTAAQRKLEVPSYEMIADYAIIDPLLSGQMPRTLTADTGIDVLTHSIEGYACTWANDYSDGLCLHATRMVFDYLPRAVANGAADPEARQKMANAATIAALGMGNSHIALAHALGHSAGTLLHIPHGRITGLFLPYTIEFGAFNGSGRYLGLAKALDLPVHSEAEAGPALAAAIRDLLRRIGQPLDLPAAGVTAEAFAANLTALCERAQMDSAGITASRTPTWEEFQKLFEYAFAGRRIDF